LRRNAFEGELHIPAPAPAQLAANDAAIFDPVRQCLCLPPVLIVRIAADWNCEVAPVDHAILEAQALRGALVFNRMKETLSPESWSAELQFAFSCLLAGFGVALGIGISPGKSVPVDNIEGPPRRSLRLLRAEVIFNPAIIARVVNLTISILSNW
jgi:hypothetical protein